MPVTIGAIGLGISAITGGIGLIQKGSANTIAKNAAAAQTAAQLKIAAETNAANESIGESNDLANITIGANNAQSQVDAAAINATINSQGQQNTAAINAQGLIQAQQVNQNGNNLLWVAGGIGAIAVITLILSHKEKMAST